MPCWELPIGNVRETPGSLRREQAERSTLYLVPCPGTSVRAPLALGPTPWTPGQGEGESAADARRSMLHTIYISSHHSLSQHVSHQKQLSVTEPRPRAEPGPQRCRGAGAWWRWARVLSAFIHGTFELVPTTGPSCQR
eukprot:scaffold5808_cov128-Isochrysis_galbana.AAC.12